MAHSGRAERQTSCPLLGSWLLRQSAALVPTSVSTRTLVGTPVQWIEFLDTLAYGKVHETPRTT